MVSPHTRIGRRCRFSLSCALGLPSLAHDGVARLGPHSGVRAGDRDTFDINVGQLHFFDGDSGRAIR
jgi:hypothetical protein